MLPEKVISIINSCKTHAQLDTCVNWSEYLFDYENQKCAKAVIQRKRSEIDLVVSKHSREFIEGVQALEH
jgi:hypothetical protein